MKSRLMTNRFIVFPLLLLLQTSAQTLQNSPEPSTTTAATATTTPPPPTTTTTIAPSSTTTAEPTTTASTTTATTVKPPSNASDIAKRVSAASLQGVSKNTARDLAALGTSLITNSLLVLGVIVAFAVLRHHFPMVYSHNVLSADVKRPPRTLSRREVYCSMLSWVGDVCETNVEKVARTAGLDSALLPEFCTLCAKMLATIGLPLALIMCPLHYWAGGGKPESDYLSGIGMLNIEKNHPWLYYFHACIVWFVCFSFHFFVHKAQAGFLQHRFGWLERLPAPRCRTILVESIPEAWRSDSKLKEFFEGIFHPGDVVDAWVVKRTGNLPTLLEKRKLLERKKLEAEMKLTESQEESRRCCGQQGKTVEHYVEELSRAEGEIRDVLIQLEADEAGKINSASGFVTFQSRKMAEIALNLRYSADLNFWQLRNAPDACDVRWQDLTRTEHAKKIGSVLAYALIAGLYLGFVPIVGFISSLAGWVHLGPLDPVWAAFAPTAGLTIFLALLPTVLLMIFRAFFVLRAEAWAQQKLQVWYFTFQVVFVLLVTALSNSLVGQLKELAENPSQIIQILSESLPTATHFYMNFLILQWTATTMEILRISNFVKFLAWRTIYDADEAKKLSEPEDQDSSGIGARSTKQTLNAVMALVFCSLEPLMPLFAMIGFIISRIIYGYLVSFAETRKPDVGGAFWVMSLKHLHFGLLLYCLLMVGVLTTRADEQYANAVAAPSILFVAWSYYQFCKRYEWQILPFDQLAFNPKCYDDATETEEVDAASADGVSSTVAFSEAAQNSDYLQPELSLEVLSLFGDEHQRRGTADV